MCTNSIRTRVLIVILHSCLWSTLDRHSINISLDWHPIEIVVNSQSTVDWCMRQLTIDWLSTIETGRLSTDCADQVSIGMLIEYWARCWSNVSIEGIDQQSITCAVSTHDPENLLVSDNWVVFISSPVCVADWTTTCKMSIIVTGCML